MAIWKKKKTGETVGISFSHVGRHFGVYVIPFIAKVHMYLIAICIAIPYICIYIAYIAVWCHLSTVLVTVLYTT